MYLVLIAWLYVALMMAAAEATAANGTLLGALVTFVLYGLLPAAIIGYVMDAPRRRRARAARETLQEAASPAVLPPDDDTGPTAGPARKTPSSGRRGSGSAGPLAAPPGRGVGESDT
ncbi:MAG: hypothetical protein ABI589_11005 [Burkholderiales bacterium]